MKSSRQAGKGKAVDRSTEWSEYTWSDDHNAWYSWRYGPTGVVEYQYSYPETSPNPPQDHETPRTVEDLTHHSSTHGEPSQEGGIPYLDTVDAADTAGDQQSSRVYVENANYKHYNQASEAGSYNISNSTSISEAPSTFGAAVHQAPNALNAIIDTGATQSRAAGASSSVNDLSDRFERISVVYEDSNPQYPLSPSNDTHGGSENPTDVVRRHSGRIPAIPSVPEHGTLFYLYSV